MTVEDQPPAQLVETPVERDPLLLFDPDTLSENADSCGAGNTSGSTE